MRNVSLTVASKLFGNPGEILSIPFILANNGPENDQYTITAQDSTGTILNQLAAVEVNGLETVNLTIDFTVPASHPVVLTATSQADPAVLATAEIFIDMTQNETSSTNHQQFVVVDNPPLSPCTITSGKTIDWACLNQGQILTDVTLENNAKISGGQLAGQINNQGFISQVTVQPDTILKGGKLSGYIVNQGTLMDFEFVGAQVSGGILAGQVINNSLIGGVFKDVHLAADAHLSGGYLQGETQGDPTAPALLEDVAIQAGSHLAYVKIGKNVTWSADVVFEDNVEFIEPTTYCNPTQLADITPLLPRLDPMIIGKSIKPCSQFGGGISTDGKPFQRQLTMMLTDSVEVLGQIAPDLRHVNQVADLVLYADYRPVATETPLYFMVNLQKQVLPWDGDVSHLVAFKEQIKLESVHSIRLYQGQFPATGQLNIQFGYRLADGTIVLNKQPLEVVVE